LVSDQIREGQAIITKSDTSGCVEIKQGTTWFLGSYEESPNGAYLVASDHEQVCLVKNLKTVLWSGSRAQIDHLLVVSNNGRFACRRPRARIEKLCIFDQNGRILVEEEFNYQLGALAISEEGNYVAVSTCAQDNSIYFFDVDKAKLMWSYKNHSFKEVFGLYISDTKIQVWIDDRRRMYDKSLTTRKHDYSLNFEGRPSEEDTEKVKQIKTISEGAIEESIDTLIRFLRSPEKDQVLKGLEELWFWRYRFQNYVKLLTPHVSSHLLDDDERISQLSEDIIICFFGDKDPSAIEPAVPTILRKIEERPSTRREDDFRKLAILGRINPQWVKNQIPMIIDSLKNDKSWEVRRSAAWTLGWIGSADPELVKEFVSLLRAHAQVEPLVRNTVIRVLGNIGEKSPQTVKDAIPTIISCLSSRSRETRKSAVAALDKIAKKDPIYVGSAIPILEKMAREDPYKEVMSEAKRLLESISPQAAERTLSDLTTRIPRLIANLSSGNKRVRYESIRELERMFYGACPRVSLPEQYQHQALLLMNQSSSDLIRCIEKIEEELKVAQNKTTRVRILKTRMMAKRTFLEFIVGEYVSSDSIRCKFCGRAYKANGIRNHLARTHPEKWKNIRPYDDETLQYLEHENQNVRTHIEN